MRRGPSPARTAPSGERARRPTGKGPRGAAPLLLFSLTEPPPRNWVRRAAELPGVNLRLLACQPRTTRPRRTVHLLELVGDPADLVPAVEQIREETSKTTVSVASPSRLLLRVEAAADPACSLLFDSGTICRACRFLAPVGPDGRIFWQVLGPRRPADRAAATAWYRLFDGTRSLQRVKVYRGSGEPSDRQREAIEVALRAGYFSVPRRATLTDIGRELGVSRSAAGELIRRGVAQLVASTPECPERRVRPQDSGGRSVRPAAAAG